MKKTSPLKKPSFTFARFRSDEWLTIEKKVLKCKLPPEAALQLNEVTEAYANCRNLGAVAAQENADWTNKKKLFTGWRNRTQHVRRAIGPKRSMATPASSLTTFREIAAHYFKPKLSLKEEKDPLALFARILDGAIQTERFIDQELELKSPRTVESELWFLWASIIIGILRNGKVPLRYEEAEKLLPGRAELLARLQARLPEHLQLRHGKSLTTAAVVAFRFSNVADFKVMREVFDHWIKGDVSFARRFARSDDPDDIFMFAVRFESYFMKATGRARKRKGMGSPH